ncbi:MAG TPA: hypothetical protein VL485_17110 [Ktedonobacteraceae bacterium]|nr:hypothetical protein [Ktedonobacteraceae bacterium]
MRVLVLLCLLFLQLSVAVSPTLAAARSSCPPATPTTLSNDATAPPSTPGSIVFNEILDNPAPKTIWNCVSQTNSSWFEFFNPHDQTYDLYTSHASIDHGQGTRVFYFPIGSIIAAYNFFVLFPPPEASVYQGHSTLRLLLQGIPVDQVTVPDLEPDQSYARMPDGGAIWQITDTPTIGVSNTPATATVVVTRPTPIPTAHSGKATHPSKQKSTHATPTTLPPTASAPTHSAGTQPAWNELSLPHLITPTARVSSSTIAPAMLPVPVAKGSIWPLFVVGAAGLATLLCGFLYWRKKRVRPPIP